MALSALTPNECRVHVIRPSLARIGLWSEAAEQLMLGTAIQESRLEYRQQIGGPALGLWQVEPATHDDIWRNFLRYRPTLADHIKSLCPGEAAAPETMAVNDQYCCAIARVKYLRVPEPLPVANDIPAMAAFWKQWYNTPEGAGTVQEFIDHWDEMVGDE